MQKALLLALVWAFTVGVAVSAEPSPSFVVVVNAESRVDHISAADLKDIFRRKLKTWPGSGFAAYPVDQEKTNPVREAFSRAIMGKSPDAMNEYWQRKIFSAEGIPPLEKKTDKQVMSWVGNLPGAVGYVGPNTELSPNVRKLDVIGGES